MALYVFIYKLNLTMFALFFFFRIKWSDEKMIKLRDKEGKEIVFIRHPLYSRQYAKHITYIFFI